MNNKNPFRVQIWTRNIDQKLWNTVCHAVVFTTDVFEAISPFSPISGSHQHIHSVRTEFIATIIEIITNVITNAINIGTAGHCIFTWSGQDWFIDSIWLTNTAHNHAAESKLICIKPISRLFTYLLVMAWKVALAAHPSVIPVSIQLYVRLSQPRPHIWLKLFSAFLTHVEWDKLFPSQRFWARYSNSWLVFDWLQREFSSSTASIVSIE